MRAFTFLMATAAGIAVSGCAALSGSESAAPEQIRVCSSAHSTKDCARLAPRVDTSPLGFTYQHYDQYGQPVRWEKCSTISYRINPGGADAQQIQAVHDAFAEASTHTGLRFQFAGDSSTKPNTHNLEPERVVNGGQVSSGGGVLVTLATPEDVPELAGSIAGLAEATWTAAASRREPGVIRSARVTIDTTTAVTRVTGPGSFATIVLHEIGHALNLGHVDEPNALMRTHLNRDVPALFPQPEQAGLRLLYTPQDC